MRRRWLAIAFAVSMATACTTQDTRPPSAGSAASPASAPAVTTADTDTTVPAAPAGSPGKTLSAGPGASIVVDGGPLPRAVVDAVSRSGGDLVDTSVWDAQFETYGLPRVVGDGVVLVEASIDATRMSNGWRRIDQLQWLFQDTSHNGVASLLDQAAAAVGLDGRAVVETSQVVDGAVCTKRVYTEPAALASPVWTLQGCAYTTFPGMYSLGVGRDGVFTGVEVPVVEPTVGQVAAVLDGTVEEVHVAFGHPEATGSATTLRISVNVSFNADVKAVVAAVAGGPLVGWQQSPGESSVMLSGTGGASWVLSDGSARFSFEGRLQS